MKVRRSRSSNRRSGSEFRSRCGNFRRSSNKISHSNRKRESLSLKERAKCSFRRSSLVCRGWDRKERSSKKRLPKMTSKLKKVLKQWIKDKTKEGNSSSAVVPGSNIIEVGRAVQRPVGSLRPIIIDGSNLAMGHGEMLRDQCHQFSPRGIQICIEYFRQRGHSEIFVFVPKYRLKQSESRDPQLLKKLEAEGYVRFTPSREAGGKRIASYDDLYILDYARAVGGIIVSNDNFRDVFEKHGHLQDTIKYRILQFTWITVNTLMFPLDPLGRDGPSLDLFLKY